MRWSGRRDPWEALSYWFNISNTNFPSFFYRTLRITSLFNSIDMVWGGRGFLEDTGISFLYLFKYLFDISQYFCQYLSHVSPFVVKPRPSIINSIHMRWSGGILERVFNIAHNAPPNQSDVFTNTQSIKQILKMHSTWLILVLDGYFRKLVHPLRASWVEQFKCWISNKFHCFDLTC